MKRKFNVLSSHLMYVFATVALCTLIIIITWLGFRSELTIESGSVDGQVETMISFNDWESINGYFQWKSRKCTESWLLPTVHGFLEGCRKDPIRLYTGFPEVE